MAIGDPSRKGLSDIGQHGSLYQRFIIQMKRPILCHLSLTHLLNPHVSQEQFSTVTTRSVGTYREIMQQDRVGGILNTPC